MHHLEGSGHISHMNLHKCLFFKVYEHQLLVDKWDEGQGGQKHRSKNQHESSFSHNQTIKLNTNTEC